MAKNFLKNSTSIFVLQQTSILSAATIIMVTVGISRVLGLLRDRLLATYFGASADLGVYFAAFRIPDMIFQLLVMGALSTAFIPVVTALLTKKQYQQAWYVTSSVLNIGLIVFLIFATLVLLFAQKFSSLIAPGFNLAETILMANLTRIMLVAQLFFIISNFLTGILQSFKRFIIPALAPVMYNVGIILGIVFLSPTFGIYGPTFGVVLGTILHFLIQFPLVKRLGLRYKILFDFHHPQVKEVGRLMFPRTIGLAVAQIDYTVDVILASLISTSSLIFFNFAQHLQLLPVGLFGAPIAQAALPTLSEKHADDDTEGFQKTFLSSLHQILFLTLPTSAFLIVLRIPAVRLVFGAARFDWEATVLTGKILAFFSLSIFAQSTVHLLARAFYAFHDSKTPVTIGVASIIVNVLASIYFIRGLGLPVWGLGLSTSIANIFNAVLLLVWLDKKIGRFNRKKLFLPAIKIFFASLVTAVALYIPMKILDQLVFDTTRVGGLILLTLTAGCVGFLVYIFLAWILKIEQLSAFLRLGEKFEKFFRVLQEDKIESVEVIEDGIKPHP